MSKVLMIAWDGAEWNVINKLRKNGELPNLSKIIENGCSGTIDVKEPLISPAIWTTMATGKTREKHGIVDFYSDKNDLKSKRIWELISEDGGSVGIFNFIACWEAEEMNGFIIPGTLSMTTETHPSKLKFIKEMRKEEKSGGGFNILNRTSLGIESLKKGVSFSTLARSGKVLLKNKIFDRDFLESYKDKRFLELDLHAELFRELYEENEPDFSIFYTNAGDQISHKYWRFHEPDGFEVKEKEVRKFGNIVADFYRKMDSKIGELLKVIDGETYIVIVSDHGFEAMEKQGRGKNFLIKSEGLLEKTGMKEKIYAVNIKDVALYRSKNGSELEDFEGILKDVKSEGKKIFDVKTKGNHIEVKPDYETDIESSDKVKIGESKYKADEVLDFRETQSGKHSKPAAFLIYGPGIKKCIEKEINTVDITPTIMHLINKGVPEDVDGEVRKDLFKEKSEIKERDVYYVDKGSIKRIESKGEKENKLKNRLEKLGYLKR